MAILFGTRCAVSVDWYFWIFFKAGNTDVQRGSGLPVPCRRTLAAALQAFARSKLPALRHPWLRWPATPALRARAPLPEYHVGI